ncbi:hypothetical protein [Alteribacillus sp. YIM 98480]|nr:hypothetical protein [Alteribacillus sp. YIM 98480]
MSSASAYSLEIPSVGKQRSAFHMQILQDLSLVSKALALFLFLL